MMRSSRLLLAAALVAAVVGLSLWWPGSSEPVVDRADVTDVPAGGDAGSLSSTWFCAASATGLDGAVHELLLTNPGEATASQLSAYNADGQVGVTTTVDVAAASTTKVDVGATFSAADLSVMVESSAGDLVVEHRVTTVIGADQVACATSASDEWHFTGLSTLRGASARLVLFNPFSTDAGLDITASHEEGVLLPPDLTGVVVPAGTAKVIDVGVSVQLRDTVALSLRLRTGRVVAETLQTFDPDQVPEQVAASQLAARGLRLQLGTAEPASDWAFADGFIGTGVSERLMILNPGDEKVEVVVQVTPFGGAEMAPEPFELEVAPRRLSVLDLSAETRIPTEGLHAIRVRTDPSDRIVVGRSVLINAAPGEATAAEGVVLRPPLSWGATISSGTPLAATRWIASGFIIAGGQTPMLLVHNPNPGIVSFSARVLGGPDDGFQLADRTEIAAGDSLAIPLADQGFVEGELTLVVESESPLVVERIVTFAGLPDLSMGMAVPSIDDDNRLVALEGN